jgi:cytochrome c oxidase subunit 2
MRRGSIASLVVYGVIAGGIAAAIALFITWLPPRASDEADRIHALFWFVIVICIAIFALVAAVMAYEIIHFRAAPDDDSDGPPVHGHTGLEIWWTLIPTVLVTAIGIVSAVILARNDAKGSRPMTINVMSQQFAWTFSYPEAKGYTSGVLRVPLGRSIVLRLESKDVLHSFWVPEFSQKQDTVPGSVVTLHITPNKLGTFSVICTELCGLGHSLMRTTAIVMEPKAFQRWLDARSGAASGPSASPGTTTGGTAGTAAGAAAFKANGCSACHTFTPAGATAKVGPDLDNLAKYAQQAGKPLEEFVHESIVDPGAYIQPGFQNGMPPFKSLPPETIDALVQYLTQKG